MTNALLMIQSLWLAGSAAAPIQAPDTLTPEGRAFAAALVASRAAPIVPPVSDIYAGLLGSWDVEVIEHDPDGGTRTGRGEWHFARVLEGRGVQDVWIVPPRTARSATGDLEVGDRYGTTLRFYDPERDVWRAIWVNPVTGAEDHLVGRLEGGEIVQTGRERNGTLVRWIFGELSDSSFVWRGEASTDEGRSWRLEAEFHARRVEPTTPPAPPVPDDPVVREVLWQSPDGDRIEHLRLVEHDGGFDAEGLIVRHGDDGDIRARYHIRGGPDWRVRALGVYPLRDDAAPLLLASDGAGHWTDAAGAPVPELDGCIDVDLHASPFTNTIAIRRLSLEPGASADIAVAFVSIEPTGAEPTRQRYTRLPGEPADRYRYEGLDTGFTAELPVDEAGLLLEYPGYFRRVWASKPRR